MAEDHAAEHNNLEEHLRSYRAFLRGATVTVLASAFVLVALCAFAFGHTWPLLLGWATIIVGLIALLIDLRSGSKSWTLSLVTLVIFGLITAANVT